MKLETERLILRPIEIEDLDEFVVLHADPEVTQFVRPLDRASAEQRLGLAAREWRERGCGMLAILDRASGRFLGRTGLKYWPQFDETELGWVLRRDAWGRGLATEATRACIEWTFAEIPVPYITAMIEPANARSVRVAERLEMTRLRDDVLLGQPVIVYALEHSKHEAAKRASD